MIWDFDTAVNEHLSFLEYDIFLIGWLVAIVLEELGAYLDLPEDGGSKLFWNVSNYLKQCHIPEYVIFQLLTCITWKNIVVEDKRVCF